MIPKNPWLLIPVAAIVAGFVAWGVVSSRQETKATVVEPKTAAITVIQGPGRSTRTSSSSVIEPPTSDSPEAAKAKAAADRGMDVVTVRSMVSSLIDVSERGDRQAIQNFRKAISRYGPVAKEVVSEVLEHRVLSEIARNELRSVYDDLQ